MIEQIERLPDISFYDDLSLDDIKQQMIEDYQIKYQELTGESIVLTEAEPITLMLYSCAVQLYQQLIAVDKAGKMNFLKYSYGDFLDNLGALKGIERKTAQKASTTVRFTLSIIRPSTVIIPKGTRVATADRTYFETEDYAEIRPGQYSVEVSCMAVDEGISANGIQPGDVSILVDPIAYVKSVENITESGGGLDVESDDSFKDRIYLSRAVATAGTEDAYRYAVQNAYPDASDVHVFSPSASNVTVLFLVGDGQIPSAEIINRVAEALDDKSIRPMTDYVTVTAPTVENYDVELDYYVGSDDGAQASQIRDAVMKAVESYTEWQDSKIGRDINPSKLIQYCMAAGAKRVEIRKPVRKVIGDTVVPRIRNTTVNYGGLEDD